MASAMLSQTVHSRAAFVPAAGGHQTRRSLTVARAHKVSQQRHETQGPSDALLKGISAVAAVQLALLPCTGAALAAGKGKLAVEGAVQAGKAAQSAVPEGAANPVTREERNSSRDKSLEGQFNTLRERIDADKILSSPNIEAGGRQNIFSPSSFNTSFDFGSGLAAPGLQVNVGLDVAGQAQDAAGKAKDAVSSSGNPLAQLTDKINGAAVTGDSPQRQLDESAASAKSAAKGVKQQLTSWAPQGGLLRLVGDDLDNASFQGGQGSGGGPSATDRGSDLPGNPKTGGDLKDSNYGFAAVNKGARDEGTGGQVNAAPRADKSNGGLPSVLGGKSLVRDDSESPEAAAKGNIAKAQQTDGNALSGIKKSLGL